MSSPFPGITSRGASTKLRRRQGGKKLHQVGRSHGHVPGRSTGQNSTTDWTLEKSNLHAEIHLNTSTGHHQGRYLKDDTSYKKASSQLKQTNRGDNKPKLAETRSTLNNNNCKLQTTAKHRAPRNGPIITRTRFRCHLPYDSPAVATRTVPPTETQDESGQRRNGQDSEFISVTMSMRVCILRSMRHSTRRYFYLVFILGLLVRTLPDCIDGGVKDNSLYEL